MNVRLKSNLGFGLIEVLVAVAIMGIISVGMMQLMEGMTKSVRAFKISSEIDQLGMRVAKYAGMGTALARSARREPSGAMVATPAGVANDNFQMCVLGGGPGVCTHNLQAAPVGPPAGFILTDPAGTPISGTPAAPMLYGIDGVAGCAPASSTCPFRVITSYWVACPSATATCGQAQIITINYTVEQIPGIFINNAAVMKTTSGQVTVNLPLPGYIGGITNRMALWSTSTDLVAGNIAQGTGADNFQIQINPTGLYATTGNNPALVVNGQIRGNTSIHMLENTVDSASSNCLFVYPRGTMRNINGTLQVCDGVTWRWVAGRVDSTSNVGFGPILKIPRLPGLYACPQNGQVGSCESAAEGPICQGQISPFNSCCMSAGVAAGCAPLF